MPIDAIAWHDRTLANHKAELANASAKGYRTASLALYGTRTDPRYAAVTIKRPQVHAAEQFADLNAAGFQTTFTQMAAKKFGPYLLAATGPANDPLIAAVFRPMATIPLTRHGLTAAQLVEQNYLAWRDGLIPVSIDAYGAPNDVRYIATWHPNTQRLAWNLDAASPTDFATRQATFDAITAQGGRAIFTTMTPAGQYLGLFVDNRVGGWNSRSGIDSAAYQTEFDKAAAAGRRPICVAAEGVGAGARFSAIFADREEPIARAWHAEGLSTVAGIDSAMQTFMQAHGIRASSLAITSGQRLVYAKGYTWAEPGYPITQPTTLFRIASVSKMFCAAAIYRLVQQGAKTADGKTFTLDTTMQSVLKLKTPDGKDPVDARFKNITVRHLLESISSLDQGLIWRHVEAATAAGKPLPCTADQLAALCAATALGTPDPGDTTNVVYGNADYFMLSQIVRKVSNAATFEAALTTLVLASLGITRVRGARSLLADQAPDEARYHERLIDPIRDTDKNGDPAFNKDGTPKYKDWPRSLYVSPSARTADRPLAPHAYGADAYEILDGCGGISAAATDIARLVAALSVTTGNPAFSADTLKTWFGNAVTATAYTGPDDHGVHGLDWARFDKPGKPATEAGNFTAAKGGWLPSHGTAVNFTSGGYGFVVTTNDGGQPDVKTDWYWDVDGDKKGDAQSVLGVTVAKDWSGVELFDDFGMAAFGAPATPAPPPVAGPSISGLAAIATVRQSFDVQRIAAASRRGT